MTMITTITGTTTTSTMITATMIILTRMMTSTITRMIMTTMVMTTSMITTTTIIMPTKRPRLSLRSAPSPWSRPRPLSCLRRPPLPKRTAKRLPRS